MAKRVSGITVEISGDTTKLGKALGDVNKQSRGLQSELRGVNTLLKMDPTNVVLIRQKQELLNTSIDKTKEKLNVLKGAQKEVQEQFDKGEITEEQYRDFQREIEATKIKLKDLKDESKDFGGVIGESLKVAGEKVTEFGKKTEEAGKKLAPFSAVAAAMLVGSGKAAIDFESAWAGVMKTVDGTPEQMDTIRQSILDMSGELPASAEEIAQVAENAGQLGIQTDNVLSFTQTMIDMGEATNMSADTASTSLARFANITQMSQGDFSRLGSTIVNLGNNMATTEGEIVDMSLRLAGTGKQVGLSEAEIMALSATMASLGINAEAGGSSMSRIMQKINTEVLSGSETMDAFAEVSGMSGSTFAKMWESDPLAAVTAFTKGLDDISSSGGDVTTILKDLGISSTQEIDTLLRMSGATEVLTGAIDMANTGWNENIALTNEAETRYGTTESKMEMLRNKIKAVAIQIGDVLIPIIQQVVDFIGKWVDKFSTLSDGAKVFIVVLLSVISAIAPLLIVIGKIAQGVGAVITIAGKLAPVFKAAWAAVTGPVGLAVIAITALVGVFIYLWNTSEEFRNFWINLWEIIKQAAIDAWEWIKEAWGSAGEFFSTLWDGIVTYFTETIPAFIDSVILWFQLLPTRISEFFTSIIESATLWVTGMYEKAVEIGTQFIATIITFFQELPYKIGFFLGAVIGAVIQWTIDMVAKAIETGSQFIANLTLWFQLLPGRISAFITNTYNNVVAWVTNMVTKASEAGSRFITNIVTWFQQLPGRIQTWLSNAISRVTTWASNMATKAGEAGSRFINNIVSWFQNLPGRIQSWLTNTISRVTTFGSSMGSKATQAGTMFFNNLVNKVKQIPGRMFSIGSDIVSGIWNGIKSMWSSMTGWFGGLLTGFVDGIKSKLKIKSPSRVFRDEVGKMIPAGITVGVKQAAPDAKRAVDDMGDDLLDSADPSMLQMMNGKPITNSSVQNQKLIDLTGLQSRMDEMVTVMNTYLPHLTDDRPIVLDNGALVGGTRNEMDRQLGRDKILKGRGRGG